MAKRVLVVEDNELNLKLFCDLLRAHEFVAEGVRDGREAVARARAFLPELIIMDIQMPHVTGYELIGQLKNDSAMRAIPIMAVTAYASREDEDRIRAAGADAYVSKPIALARFIEQVRKLIVAEADEAQADEEIPDPSPGAADTPPEEPDVPPEAPETPSTA